MAGGGENELARNLSMRGVQGVRYEGRAWGPVGYTYVQVSLRVKVKNMIIMAKHSVLGTSAVMRRNLANSLEDHALSRYLPP